MEPIVGCRLGRYGLADHAGSDQLSKVYHKDGQFYGKTKHGEFMTEADAQKAGYRAAKASVVGKKKSNEGKK